MTRKILFIAPSFFEYPTLIKSELQKQGWEVTYLPDRPPVSGIMKILIRKFRFLVADFLDNYYDKLLVPHGKFDTVLIIKGESLTAKTLKKIKDSYCSGPVVLYFWDNIRNFSGALENSKIADYTFTFDSKDAEKFNFQLLPLFYIKSDLPPADTNHHKWSVTFIGSNHSDRMKVLSKIKNLFNDKLPIYIFFYFPSRLLYYYRKFFDPSFKKFKDNEIHLIPLTKNEIDKIYAHSNAIIDIHHTNQNGLTMRTMETLSMGKKLITTNSEIKNYPFYDPKQILIIDRKNPIISLDFLNSEPALNFINKMAAFEISEWVKKLSNPTQLQNKKQ